MITKKQIKKLCDKRLYVRAVAILTRDYVYREFGYRDVLLLKGTLIDLELHTRLNNGVLFVADKPVDWNFPHDAAELLSDLLDTETFFDSKNKYSLRSKGMTQESYVRDLRFELISMSVAVDDGEPRCFYRDDPRWDDFIRWLRSAVKTHPVVSHNAPFDMSILAWRLDVHPVFMADTLAMARPMHLKCSAEELAKHYGLAAKLDTLSKYMNGRHLTDMSPELRTEFAEYNNQDVRLCRVPWHLLKPHYTLKELKLIHLTLDMYLYPRVQIDTAVLNAQLNKILSDRDDP